MRVKTLKVFWKGKFDGAQVTINAEDFDPALHSTEAPRVEAKPEPKPKAKAPEPEILPSAIKAKAAKDKAEKTDANAN